MTQEYTRLAPPYCLLNKFTLGVVYLHRLHEFWLNALHNLGIVYVQPMSLSYIVPCTCLRPKICGVCIMIMLLQMTEENVSAATSKWPEYLSKNLCLSLLMFRKADSQVLGNHTLYTNNTICVLHTWNTCTIQAGACNVFIHAYLCVLFTFFISKILCSFNYD